MAIKLGHTTAMDLIDGVLVNDIRELKDRMDYLLSVVDKFLLKVMPPGPKQRDVGTLNFSCFGLKKCIFSSNLSTLLVR